VRGRIASAKKQAQSSQWQFIHGGAPRRMTSPLKMDRGHLAAYCGFLWIYQASPINQLHLYASYQA
jgi:hypothetical protein